MLTEGCGEWQVHGGMGLPAKGWWRPWQCHGRAAYSLSSISCTARQLCCMSMVLSFEGYGTEQDLVGEHCLLAFCGYIESPPAREWVSAENWPARAAEPQAEGGERTGEERALQLQGHLGLEWLREASPPSRTKVPLYQSAQDSDTGEFADCFFLKMVGEFKLVVKDSRKLLKQAIFAHRSLLLICSFVLIYWHEITELNIYFHSLPGCPKYLSGAASVA